jgi:hypothetical protein
MKISYKLHFPMNQVQQDIKFVISTNYDTPHRDSYNPKKKKKKKNKNFVSPKSAYLCQFFSFKFQPIGGIHIKHSSTHNPKSLTVHILFCKISV